MYLHTDTIYFVIIQTTARGRINFKSFKQAKKEINTTVQYNLVSPSNKSSHVVLDLCDLKMWPWHGICGRHEIYARRWVLRICYEVAQSFAISLLSTVLWDRWIWRTLERTRQATWDQSPSPPSCTLLLLEPTRDTTPWNERNTNK